MNVSSVTLDDGVRLHLEVDGPSNALVILFSHSVGCDALVLAWLPRAATPNAVT